MSVVQKGRVKSLFLSCTTAELRAPWDGYGLALNSIWTVSRRFHLSAANAASVDANKPEVVIRHHAGSDLYWTLDPDRGSVVISLCTDNWMRWFTLSQVCSLIGAEASGTAETTKQAEGWKKSEAWEGEEGRRVERWKHTAAGRGCRGRRGQRLMLFGCYCPSSSGGGG